MKDEFPTPAEALGEDAVEQLAQLEDVVLRLDLLVAAADLTEKRIKSMDSDALPAFANYLSEHPEERWAYVPGDADHFFGIDDVPPGLDETEWDAAIVYPHIHMKLLGWWLVHAWRFIDLADTAIKSLHSWQLTTAAIASRALMEEVCCFLYEAEEISKRWSEAKSLPPNDREGAIGQLFTDKLFEFLYAARGFEDSGIPSATNVLTYIQKFEKRYPAQSDALLIYKVLSNAAHPAVYAKTAYASLSSAHATGAYHLRPLSRRPTAAGHSQRGHPLAGTALQATIVFGSEGWRFLYQALFMVDDFGLTTRTGLLTLYPYWRKFMPGRRSSDICPCGCGKWRSAKHQWGQPAPEFRVPPPPMSISDPFHRSTSTEAPRP